LFTSFRSFLLPFSHKYLSPKYISVDYIRALLAYYQDILPS
jgi:hypothetical protein